MGMPIGILLTWQATTRATNDTTNGNAKMKVANATKKLTKAGFEVTSNGRSISAKKGRYVINVTANGGDLTDTVATVRVRAACDLDDSQSDYSAGVYCDNVSQAIRLAC